MQTHHITSSALFRLPLAAALSIALASSLTACGGGSNVRPSTPVTPADPCVANPNLPDCQPDNPPDDGGDDNGGDNGGGDNGGDNNGGGGNTSGYLAPDDNHLIPTHVQDAQAEGFTGQGVKVAIIDSGVDPDLGPLKGRDFHFLSYTDDAWTGVDASPSDNGGHGSGMAMLLAGAKTDDYLGGVAPDVDLYVSQVCKSVSSCTTTSQQVADRLAQGVKLFSVSLGSNLPTDPADIQQATSDVASVYQNGVDAGALFVFPTGNKPGTGDFADMNSGNPDGRPSDTAYAPVEYPALQKGWLAVTNVAIDDDQYNTTAGKVTGLSSTAVACGKMAEWCLAAPGFVKTLPVPGTIYDTGYGMGTSNSTAIVAGVAALVWQAYPWMSATNVKQTLLTTATHLGDGPDDQPNSTFGWGLVDAEKAVHGPGQFAFGDFLADVGDANATFSNPISGNGGLVLRGTTGSLWLTADNTYTGDTLIKGGSLGLSGSITSTVTIQNDATLAGTGTVNGDVRNSGGVLASGTGDKGVNEGMSITGDYSVTPSATTAITIGNPLTVGGTANLDGAVELLPASDKYTPKSTETLINADRVSGTFSKTEYADSVFYTATLHYDPTSVSADLTRKDVSTASAASSPVAVHAAQGVEGALEKADVWSQSNYADHKTFLDHAAKFLRVRTQAAATTSLKSIGGEAYGTLVAIEAAQAQYVDNAVAMRQNGTLSGDHVAVWVQAFGNDGAIAQSGYASARYRGTGEMLGLDIPVTDGFTLGLLAGRNHMNADMDGLAGRVRARNTLAGIYGKWALKGDAYLAARATWMHAKLDLHRTINLGGDLLPVTGQRTDGIGRVTVEFGKTFGAFTPYVSLGQIRIDEDGFTEQGGGGFGLTAGNQRQNATVGDLGLRYANTFTTGMGTSTLTAYAAWHRVLSGTGTNFTAALQGAPTATFTATGQRLTRDSGRVGVTLNTRVNQRWDWYLNLDAQGAPHRAHGFSANAGLRFRF